MCFFFAWALIYETKGLSLEQVDELYEVVPQAWKCRGFVPSAHAFKDEVDIAPVGTTDKMAIKTETESIEDRSV